LKGTTGNYRLAAAVEQETYSKGLCGGPELKILFLAECVQVFFIGLYVSKQDTDHDICIPQTAQTGSLLRLNNLTDQKRHKLTWEHC
jgi:hypothetical protein